MTTKSVLDFPLFIKENTKPSTDGWAFESNIEITALTDEAKAYLKLIVLDATDDEEFANSIENRFSMGDMAYGVGLKGSWPTGDDDMAKFIVKAMTQKFGNPHFDNTPPIQFLGFHEETPIEDASWVIWTLEGYENEDGKVEIVTP